MDSSVDTVRIKKILFSQNPPTDFEKTPYAKIAKRYNVDIDFFKFFQIEGLTVKSFLSRNISILNHTAIILTSKNAIDHFFRIINELKITLPITTKYFCVNDAIANYLRKYIVCRSRKTFYPKDGKQEKLVEEIINHSSDTFLLPSATDSSLNQLVDILDKQKINYTKADVFKIYFPNVSKEIDIYSYDMIVFFSPYGIQSLRNNYPDFKQKNIVIGALGTRVVAAAQEAGLDVQIIAPTLEHPSIFSAIDQYLQKTNGRKR